MTDQDIIQFGKKLVEAGIQLNANYEPIGCQFGLRPSDLVPYLRDRDAFFAAECGMDKADYLAWKAFMNGGRKCGAKTRSGACTHPVKGSAGMSPQEFLSRREEDSLSCSRHLSLKDRREPDR